MRSSPKGAGDPPRLFGIPMKWVSLVMLVAQTVGVVFAMRLSRVSTSDGPRYLTTTAVFFSELVKLGCSFLFLSYEAGGGLAAASLVLDSFSRQPGEAAKVSVPGLLYTLQNNLLFVSLSNLSGAVYQVTYQLKILTTAVLSVVLLGRALGLAKWLSLLMLTLGVCFIQFPRTGGGVEAEGSAALGLSAVLAACMTSGLAGVYLEKILKQASTSIWLRNIQLAIFGSLTGLIGCFIQDGEKIRQGGFMQGYSSLVWSVILLQAVGGLIVAAVLKYADNILKCFGNAMSIVIGCILSAAFLQEFEPDLMFVVGTVFVLAATTLYSFPSILKGLLDQAVGRVDK